MQGGGLCRSTRTPSTLLAGSPPAYKNGREVTRKYCQDDEPEALPVQVHRNAHRLTKRRSLINLVGSTD